MDVRIDHLFHWPQHLPAIARWQHEQFGYLNPSVTLQQREDRLRQATDLSRLPIALIALSNENLLLGAASILATTLTHKHLTPWLSSVFVPPAYRGQGIASALCVRAIEEAARLGFEQLYLFTPHKEAMYARLGWSIFEHAVHNGVSLAIMRRETSATR